MIGQPVTLTDVIVNRNDSIGKFFTALRVDKLLVPAGANIGIAGPSGAGKSTLLDLIAGVLLPSTGSVRWGETAVSSLNDRSRALWRLRNIGQIFQDFLLIPELSVLANVLLPLNFAQIGVRRHQREYALSLIHDFGLTDARKLAGFLSRGEQQRVAIARALILKPSIILADEPTASLDKENASLVTDLLFHQSTQHKATLIITSHDPAILERVDRVYQISDGLLKEG